MVTSHALSPDLRPLFAVAATVRELPQRSGPDGPPDDADLVRRALRGDRWAEEALYRRHVQAVNGLATRLLGRTAEAEDVTQDTFVTALNELADLRQADSFRSWLLRIAVHQVHRRFRRRRLLRTLGLDRGDDDALLEKLADHRSDVQARAELAELDTILSRLPSKDRVPWMLRHVEGYQLEEIAEICDCSLATVKRRIQSAHRRVLHHSSVEVGGST